MVIVANINERTNQNLIYQTKYFRFRSFLMDFDFIKTQVPLPLTPLFIFIKLFQSFWVQSAQIKSGYICSQGQRSLQTIPAERLFWFSSGPRTGPVRGSRGGTMQESLYRAHIIRGGSELGIVESATYSLAPRDWRLILNGSEFSIWILKGN